MLNLTTGLGELAIAFQPAGTEGYEDLLRHVEHYDLDGLVVPVASLEDVIRSKRAAGRAKDAAALPTLETQLSMTKRSS